MKKHSLWLPAEIKFYGKHIKHSLWFPAEIKFYEKHIDESITLICPS
jgi:hypothetical protein